MTERVHGADRPADQPAGHRAELDAVLEGIADVAREHLQHTGPLPLEARLVEDLELDSLQLLTLAVEVENRFEVCLDENEASISTVAELAEAVVRRLATGGDASPSGSRESVECARAGDGGQG